MKKSLLTFCGLMCALFLSAQTLSPKRGVSFNYTNEADLKAMSGTSWFYNWGPTPNNVGNIISSYHHEFCPMIWSGDGDANAIRNYVKSHPECKYLLWLNEPNFKEQAYMTPQQAAAKFPAAKALCQELGLKMISPACNYSAWAEYNTPAKWYDEFFKLVDKSNFAGLAIHSYMGWATATANYVEEYYQRYGLPIWLTEFCHWDDFTSNNGGTKEQQLKEMIDAVELLETNPHVARYAWFIPRRDGQAQPAFPYMELLSNANGVLTDLGKVWNNMSSYDNNYYHSTNSRIEAEHYISRASGMYMEETEDKSGEINFYGMSSGHQLAYNLNVASAGTYNIRFRVLTVSDAKIQVSTSAGSQTFALKNSNGKWESQDFTIPLTFGKQLMQVKLTSGGNVKFNYMELYSGNLPTDMGIVDPNQEIGEQVVVPQNVMGFAFDMENVPSNYANYNVDGIARKINIWQDEWSDKLTLTADGDGFLVNDLGWWGIGYNVAKKSSINMTAVDEDWRIHLDVKASASITSLELILGGYSGSEGKIQIADYVKVKDGNTYNTIDLPLSALTGMPNYSKIFADGNYFCLVGNGEKNAKIAWKNVYVYTTSQKQETAKPTYDGYIFVSNEAIPNNYQDYRTGNGRVLQIWKDEWSDKLTLVADGDGYRVNDLGWWGFGYNVTDGKMDMRNVDDTWKLSLEVRMDQTINTLQVILGGYGGATGEGKMNIQNMVSVKDGQTWNKIEIPLWMLSPDMPNYTREFTKVNYFCLSGDGSANSRIGWRNVKIYKDANSTIETSQYQGYAFTTPSVPAGYADYRVDDKSINLQIWGDEWSGVSTLKTIEASNNQMLFTIGNVGWWGAGYYVTYEKPMNMNNIKLADWTLHVEALMDSNVSEFKLNLAGAKNTEASISLADMCTSRNGEVYNVLDIPLTYFAGDLDYSKPLTEMNFMSFTGGGSEGARVGWKNVYLYKSGNSSDDNNDDDNTGNEGGNTGNEGGNTGNEGGNTGNEGGNTQPVEGNLALNKSITSSTALTDMSSINNANDGKENTRWETKHEDVPSTVTIDLEQVYSLQEIAISWETACASDYTVEVSKDGNVWTNVANFSGLSGAHKDEITLNNAGRYVRINCQKRATQYGYSIWEVEVYGNAYTSGDNNEGGNTGNEGGNTGNEGGNT
ncbi:MAG: discoidin domain-containing protein, partial [Paludibacteraceae bacterium]|nr:discoidin domain-containing protein [Paludibacteraceae bacterium]